ncbi:MAG: SPOR domain-containing protein [Thermodesulfovibrionales bacterium]
MKGSFVLKISIRLILILFLIYSISAYAEKDNWISIGVINNELWFVDIDSILCEANSCKVWVKMLPRISAKRLPLEDEGYSKSLFDYNCTWMEYRIVETTKYDSSGHLIKHVLLKEQNKKYKIEEPVGRQFHDLVCQKVEQQKKEQRQIRDSEEKKPMPKKQKLSTPIFTVQVGAFKNISYARSLKRILNRKGYHTYIIHTKKKGDLYKVCIGRFTDRKEANVLAEKIKRTEGYQTFVAMW